MQTQVWILFSVSDGLALALAWSLALSLAGGAGPCILDLDLTPDAEY